MKKRFSKKGGRRRRGSTGQDRQQLRKTVQSHYPDRGVNHDADAWSDDALEALDEWSTPDVAVPGRRSTPVERHRPSTDMRNDVSPTEDGDTWTARIVALASGQGTAIDAAGNVHTARLPSALARDQRHRIAAGDRVHLRRDPDEAVWVHEVLPRRTTLSRPDPLNPHQERVIAANVDVVVHVQAARRPPLRPALVDRYLVAIARSGAQPVLCINKVDLLEADGRAELDRLLAPYREQSLPIVLCSVIERTGLDDLRRHLVGKLGVFVGHSGVGKSSLLNALATEARAATGSVSERGTGRHTTTGSALHQLPGPIEIIDTPGIRELGLWSLDAPAIDRAFPDIATWAADCRFANCAHRREPECAVRDAVAKGRLVAARLATYHRLHDSLTNDDAKA